ncbi:MAG: DegV family protein [Clostridia bacterium]|nr:DegV family protein [Clostridia bacterium]
MTNAYQIVTDATADLSPELMAGLPEVAVIPMTVLVDREEYTYGPGGNISAAQFYAYQRIGRFASTAGVNPYTYATFFEPILRQGKDILYLGFSSGLSGMIQSAMLCADELAERYPGRKIVCVDTLCASVGEGFLVHEAAQMQAQGMSLDELTEWVYANCLCVNHWFSVDSFDHLLQGGRIHAVTAAAGNALQVKPLLRVNEDGRLVVASMPRGQGRARLALLGKMAMKWQPERGNLVIVGHGGNPESAERLRKMVADRFPTADIRIMDIGPVIGAHTGPDMLALVFWGNTR